MSSPHTHGGTDAPECTTCRPAVASGGVRDTLAAAQEQAAEIIANHIANAHQWSCTGRADEQYAEHIAAVLAHNQLLASTGPSLDALSSPEVVRVATEVLALHRGLFIGGGMIRCCGWSRSEADHAAHQWSVLVAARRGER